MALPLAVIGLGGVLALVLLQGEQPGEQASGKPVQTTARATLVSAHRSKAVTPSSSGSSASEAPEEEGEAEEAGGEVRDTVRSGPGAIVAEAPTAAPPAGASSAEERRRGGPRNHRHRPTGSITPSTGASTTVAEPPTTAPGSMPVEPVPTESVVPVTPEPTVEPVPSSDPAPVPAPAPEVSASE